jgi:hypothetical protein
MKAVAYGNKQKAIHIGMTLRYSLYVITHPLDGFWDLTHENRGSVAAANIIYFLALLTTILKLQFTSFIFNKIIWEYVNIIEIVLGFLAPIVMATVSNWALTTLFDGKGTMRHIYMALGYALTPFVLIQFPMIFISNLMTVQEGAFYYYINSFSSIWCGMLVISAVMMIHDYSLGKAFATIFATIIGILLIVFIILLFFSLITDAAAYFISLYKEIAFRFY